MVCVRNKAQDTAEGRHCLAIEHEGSRRWPRESHLAKEKRHEDEWKSAGRKLGMVGFVEAVLGVPLLGMELKPPGRWGEYRDPGVVFQEERLKALWMKDQALGGLCELGFLLKAQDPSVV